MKFKDCKAAISKRKLNSLNKSSSKIYDEVLGEDLKVIFSEWGTEDFTNNILNLFELSFQAGYVLGKTNRKQKHD
jgi:hypothetical protein